MKRRIASFDTFKAIMAFLVVFMHYPWKLEWTDEIVGLARIAVPFFFMVSGYFNYSKELRSEKIKKEVIKTIRMLIYVNFIYLAFRISVRTYYALRDGYSVERTIVRILAQLTRKRFIFLNFGLAGHLWYLRALIMVLLILVVMKKLKLEFLVKISIPIIVVMDLCLCKYSLVLFSDHVPRKYFEPLTKFIAVGYVYFFAGYFYHELEERKWYQKLKQFIMRFQIIPVGVIILFSILNILEYEWLSSKGLNVEPCNYCSTPFLAISIFMYLSMNVSIGKNSIVNVIGRKYSDYIYFYHVLAGKILSILFKDTKLYPFIYCVRSLIIYVAVILCIKFIFYIRDKRKKTNYNIIK